MEYFFIFLKGFIVGFLISTPVSPIGIVCFRRYIKYGSRIGFFSGLGSATADFILSIIAALGLSFIMHTVNVHEGYVRLAGSIFFILLGIYVLSNPPYTAKHAPQTKSILRSYFSILVLTLSNPATIPSFAALFAGLGVGTTHTITHLIMLASSISLGATAWWALLAVILAFAKPHLHYATLKKINTLCGITIIAFGIITLLRMLRILL